MSESKPTFESARHWVAQHKLRTVGCLWLSGITGSIAYNWSRPQMKTSVRLIHASNAAQTYKVGSIYQLGDSISDTGNLILDSPNGPASSFARLPYGSSFFNHSTGRCSNGLLIIDFIAKAVGLPLLEPYLNNDALFKTGANFAVAGATALSSESLADKGVLNPLTNTSLSAQLDWLWSHLNAICYDDTDCLHKLKDSLFIVGEIGSNDYYYALLQGKTIEDVNGMVLDVVQAIAEGVRRVIQTGASKVLVPGMFPLGQFPAYLSAYEANKSASYDDSGSKLNNLSLLHNNELQKAIEVIRKEQKDVTVVYVDYYNAFMRLLRNAARLGFNATSDVQNVCCGTGRQHNYDPTETCGARGVEACSNPDGYIIWDGINLTQKAYSVLAQWFVQHIISAL